MGDGYVRQSAADIVTGNVVEAGPLNAEYNALQSAFHETSGHSHDGTTGEGPKISLISSVSGILQTAQGGTGGIHKLNGTIAPTVNDDSGDGYAVGSIWVDTVADTAYICVDSTATAAVWDRIDMAAALSAIAALTPAADRVPYYTGASTAALATLTSFARTILDDADAATVRTTIGAQASDAELTAIAGLTSAADKGIQFTGVGTAATYDLTTFAKTLLDDANQAAMQTTLGLVPGTNVQAFDADLSALAALSGTNNIYYRSGANTWSSVTVGPGLSFTGGTLDAVAAASDATITAIAGLTPGADQGIYFTGTDVAATFSLTSFARTILDDANQATVQATLGLVPGTNVQAFDADLSAVAGLASNGLIARTGAGTAAVRTLTAPAAGITVSNGDGVSGNPTLALANDLAALEALSGTNTLYYRSAADTWTPVTIGSGVSFSGGTLSATSSGPTLLTPLATTSGTTKDWTIPAGAKRITMMWDAVSSSAGGDFGLQIGDAGGIETTGYLGSYASLAQGDATVLGSQFSTTFRLASGGSGATIWMGGCVLTRLNSSHLWVFQGITSDSNRTFVGGGTKTLSAELTTVRLMGVTFDAGTANVMWE